MQQPFEILTMFDEDDRRNEDGAGNKDGSGTVIDAKKMLRQPNPNRKRRGSQHGSQRYIACGESEQDKDGQRGKRGQSREGQKYAQRCGHSFATFALKPNREHVSYDRKYGCDGAGDHSLVAGGQVAGNLNR